MKEYLGTGVQGCGIAPLLPLKSLKVTSVSGLVPLLGGEAELFKIPFVVCFFQV